MQPTTSASPLSALNPTDAPYRSPIEGQSTKSTARLQSGDRSTESVTGSSLRDRIESVAKAFFSDIKGFGIFFGGFNSLNSLIDLIGLDKPCSRFFSLAEELGSQIKEIGGLAGILNARKAIYCAADLWDDQWQLNNWSVMGVVAQVNSFAANFALPLTTALGCLAARDFIRAEKSSFAPFGTFFSITMGSTGFALASRKIHQEWAKTPSLWKKAMLISDVVLPIIGVSALLCSSLYLIGPISEVPLTGLKIFEGLFKFTKTFVENWKNPQPISA